MKVSYIQVFDVREDAVRALGRLHSLFPDNANSMVETSNQIQLWSKVKNMVDHDIFGELDDEVVYLVLSLAG